MKQQKTLTLTTLFASIAMLSLATASQAYDAASESNQSAKVVTQVQTNEGKIFANGRGLSLYIYTKDSAGKSNCYGGCAVSWPPFIASNEAKAWGGFTKIKRNDGKYQWAYNNQPLYTWAGDLKAGDTNGQGVGNVWYVVQVPQ